MLIVALCATAWTVLSTVAGFILAAVIARADARQRVEAARRVVAERIDVSTTSPTSTV